MKELTLTPTLKMKLERLTIKPKPLFYIGADISHLEERPIVAIVGTRKPTPYGKAITVELAEKLAKAGVTIISGNAMGVDVIAQQAALDAGGRVIAVVPSGLDNIYPATNRPVAKKIIEKGGTVLTEFESGHVPMAHDFLHRNRIIAALSDIVVIPEAAERSGSLNTAKHATEMRIPIGVVPGHVTSHMSSGTNRLLKDGAHVIRSAEDVLELLGIDGSQQQISLNLEGDNPAETAILQAIHDGAQDSHEIRSKAGLSATEFQMTITMLEVAGRIKSTDLGTLRLL